jgi:hypothetical protein
MHRVQGTAQLPGDAGAGLAEQAILVKCFVAKLGLEQVDPRGFTRSRRVEFGVPVVGICVKRRRFGHYGKRCMRMSWMSSAKEDSEVVRPDYDQ